MKDKAKRGWARVLTFPLAAALATPDTPARLELALPPFPRLMHAQSVERLSAALSGRYTLMRELGEGGMAYVYLAEDIRHKRHVALKVLKPEVAAVVGAARFLAEIETTARLQHPHILPLFDSGQVDGFLFYVMPALEGESLRDRLDREHQLPIDEAVRIASNLADALDYAHRQGVIHRDIKPANVLLADDKPVLSDFGIALAMGGAGDRRLTETGLSLGTPHYMSPEQATGDGAVRASSDIWALGCVLYEMLVGEPPYTGTTPQAVLGRIVTSEPDPVREHRRTVPENVEAAIRRSLEKVPADRFASARDFVLALANPSFRHGPVDLGNRAVQRWRRSAVAGWAVAGLMAMGVGAWALLRPTSAPNPVSRMVLAQAGLAGLEAPFGRLAAVAPDGSSTVLPVGAWPADYHLGLKLRASTEVVPIPDTDRAQDVGFSPDGRWITFRIDRDVFRRRLAGGGTERLARDAEQLLTWLEDGTILYRPSQEAGQIPELVRIPAEGGDPLQVIELSGPESGFPIWTQGLAEARAVLVVHCGEAVTCAADTAGLYALDLTDGSMVEVMAGIMRAWYLAEVGHLVVVRADGAVLALPFDVGALRPDGTPIPLFEGVRLGAGQADMIMGNDGTVLYVEGEGTAFGLAELVLVDRTGVERPLDVALPARGYTTLALAPDDRRLAVSIESVLSSEIWVKELPEGPLTRQTDHAAITRWPTWSADGSSISYTNNSGGKPHIRSIRADGGSTFGVVLQRDLPVLEAIHTPDMRGLYFREGASAGEARFGYLDLVTGTATAWPAVPGTWQGAIALSPDAGWLAFMATPGEVFVRPVGEGGGRTQVSISGGANPVWAHNGRELFYIEPATRDLMAATYTLEPTFRVVSRARLFDASDYRIAPEYHGGFDVTADDQSFVMMRSAPGDTRIVVIENWLDEVRERLRR